MARGRGTAPLIVWGVPGAVVLVIGIVRLAQGSVGAVILLVVGALMAAYGVWRFNPHAHADSGSPRPRGARAARLQALLGGSVLILFLIGALAAYLYDPHASTGALLLHIAVAWACFGIILLLAAPLILALAPKSSPKSSGRDSAWDDHQE